MTRLPPAGYELGVHGAATLTAAAAMALLGIYVLLTERDSPEAVDFSVFAFAVVVWLSAFGCVYGAPDASAARLWVAAAYVGVPLIPPALYQFSIQLLDRSNRRTNLTAGILWAFGLVAAGLCAATDVLIEGVHRYDWGYYPRYSEAGIGLVAFVRLGLGASLRQYFVAYRLLSRPAPGASEVAAGRSRDRHPGRHGFPPRLRNLDLPDGLRLRPGDGSDHRLDRPQLPPGGADPRVRRGEDPGHDRRPGDRRRPRRAHPAREPGRSGGPGLRAGRTGGTSRGRAPGRREGRPRGVGRRADDRRGRRPGDRPRGPRRHADRHQRLRGSPPRPGRPADRRGPGCPGHPGPEGARGAASAERPPGPPDRPAEPGPAGGPGRPAAARSAAPARAALRLPARGPRPVQGRQRPVRTRGRRRAPPGGGRPAHLRPARGGHRRPAGDEFGVLLPDLGESPVPQGTRRVAERIHEALEPPFSLQGEEVHVTATVGAAVSRGDEEDAGELLQAADLAMYEAKTRPDESTALYEPALRAEAEERVLLENDLRGAAGRDELVLEYQPVYDLDTLAPVGFEALVRWEHPEHGRLSPGEFIPLAEERGLIVEVGRWVLEEACGRMESWLQEGVAPDDARMMVNVAPSEILSPGFADAVSRALEQSGLPPEVTPPAFRNLSVSFRLLFCCM